jgi:cysteine/O-acetylserine efflux protein
MSPDLLPVLSYILITTFTPGPSNISSASMGVLYGFRRTLVYLAGLAAGVFLIMSLSAWISAAALNTFPILEPALKIVGALYILYLAYSILRESYTFKDGETRPMGFFHGVLLQIVNPKLFVYAFSLFSAVLVPFVKTAPQLIFAVVLLTLTSFAATAVWALFGTAIKAYLHIPRVKLILNVVLALLLVVTAVQLLGVL